MKIRGIEFNLHENEALSNHIRREQDFFEPDILDYLRESHPHQKTIIDVGANIGNHSIYFANFLKYEEILCFEPVKSNFDILKTNLPYPNIKLFQQALSDKTETLKMSANLGNMGASKIDPMGEIDVSAITLDSLDLQDVSLIKIDVENFEPSVLKGAKETINRCKPLILIEDWRQTYTKLLPNYVLEKAWPKHKTYLYKWQKPYLISICSYTPGVDRHMESLPKLEESVERINVELASYPGHLYRWDHIPKELDRNRVFVFTDTSDVIFQKPLPYLSPEKIYVANEGEIFQNNRFWRAVIRRNPQFNILNTETIYNVGTFACSGKIMDTWVSFIQSERTTVRSMVTEQLLFNIWLRKPENSPLITEISDLFTSLYANMEKGTTFLDGNHQFKNKAGELYSVVHFNGNTKSLLNQINL